MHWHVLPKLPVLDEEAKTLRPGSKSGGVKVGAGAGAKQQLRAGRLFSPDRLNPSQ